MSCLSVSFVSPILCLQLPLSLKPSSDCNKLIATVSDKSNQEPMEYSTGKETASVLTFQGFCDFREALSFVRTLCPVVYGHLLIHPVQWVFHLDLALPFIKSMA